MTVVAGIFAVLLVGFKLLGGGEAGRNFLLVLAGVSGVAAVAGAAIYLRDADQRWASFAGTGSSACVLAALFLKQDLAGGVMMGVAAILLGISIYFTVRQHRKA